jgi:hypothetical protein
MKPILVFPLGISVALFMAACDKPAGPAQSNVPAPPAAAPSVKEPTPPMVADVVPAGPSEAEQRLALQVKELEVKQLELEQRLEEERLAATEKEIERERALLEKEREAFALEQQLAEAKNTASTARESRPPESSGSTGKVPAYAPGANYDYQKFYDELDPVGSWFESAEYGYVWQPSVYVADRSWRPYTRGRWVNTDYGWTWCSDENFGWACYHYGRWACLDGIGWVWVPGDQWGPAWVSWRKSSSYVGWCPLPPETVYDVDVTYDSSIDRDCGLYPGGYVFVPVRHFDEPVLGHCEAPSISINIYSTTVNITNLIVRRDRVECYGPERDWIAQCTRRPVPRLALHWDYKRDDDRDGRFRSPKLEKERIFCYAPRVSAPWNPALRPSRHSDRKLDSRVLRGDSGLAKTVENRFESAKKVRWSRAEKLNETEEKIVERQHKLADLKRTKLSLVEQVKQNPEILAGGRGPSFQSRPGNGESTGSRGQAVPSGTAVAQPVAEPPVAQPETAARPSAVEGAKPDARSEAFTRREKDAAQLTEARAELERLRAESLGGKGQPAKPPVDAGGGGTPDNAPPETGVAAQPSNNGEGAKNRGAMADRIREARQKEMESAQKKPAAEQPREFGKTKPAVEPQPDASAMEQKRQELERRAAAARQAQEETARQREQMEQARRYGKQHGEAAKAEQENQNATRAAMERQELEPRTAAARQAQEEAARQREQMEQARRYGKQREEAARAEQENQNTRAAMEQKSQEAERRAAALRKAREDGARQREQIEQQHAAVQQQAREAARQRESMEQQRREAQEAARREEMQRRAQQEQTERQEQMRRQAEEQSRREEQRRQAEEQFRREEQRRQMEEFQRRETERQDRERGKK